MGVFKRNGRIDPDGLDWYLLQNGWASLYWRRSILNEDLKWLEEAGYEIVNFDCRTWNSDKIIHAQLKEKFGFPDYYGENFDALSDCLSDLNIIKTGLVIVFRHMDSIKKATAHTILDIIANNARYHLLFGSRLISLAQVDNPHFEIDPIGQTPVGWNGREWLNSSRELKE